MRLLPVIDSDNNRALVHNKDAQKMIATGHASKQRANNNALYIKVEGNLSELPEVYRQFLR